MVPKCVKLDQCSPWYGPIRQVKQLGWISPVLTLPIDGNQQSRFFSSISPQCSWCFIDDCMACWIVLWVHPSIPDSIHLGEMGGDVQHPDPCLQQSGFIRTFRNITPQYTDMTEPTDENDKKQHNFLSWRYSFKLRRQMCQDSGNI